MVDIEDCVPEMDQAASRTTPRTRGLGLDDFATLVGWAFSRTVGRLKGLRRGRRTGAKTALIGAAVLAVGSCESGTTDPFNPPGTEVGESRAFGIWSPTVHDTCSKEIHDSYSVVGPDGLRYPTWHPPVDPATGCSFGHEHGRDPRGSDLFSRTGMIPFGYANQQLDLSDFGQSRHEDHVGHKIEWENDVEMRVGDGGGGFLNVQCDVLFKMHQGSHSADAFTNNMHELVYYASCTDGTEIGVTILTPIGTAGQLVVGCDRGRVHQVGIPTPPNSPDGGGRRAIPDISCIQNHMLVPEGGNSNFNKALRESWEIGGKIRTPQGRRLLSFNPYFQVFLPSRAYDPSVPGGVVRPIDFCYDDGAGVRARGDLCEQVQTGNGERIAHDDPRSPFNGARRFVDINDISIRNADGPEIWYTDPLGNNASTSPFPGSIRQFIARHDNSALAIHGPNIGADRDYGTGGVHAPN